MRISRSTGRLGAKSNDERAHGGSGHPEMVAKSAKQWWVPFAAGGVLVLVAVVAQAVFGTSGGTSTVLAPALLIAPGAFLSGFAYNNRLRQLGREEGGWWLIQVRTLETPTTNDPS